MASSQRPNPVDNLLRGFTAPADHHLLPPPDPEHAAIFARLQEGSNRRQSLYRDVLQSLSRALLEGLRFKKSSSTQENGKSPQQRSLNPVGRGAPAPHFSSAYAEQSTRAGGPDLSPSHGVSPGQPSGPKKSVLQKPLPLFDGSPYPPSQPSGPCAERPSTQPLGSVEVQSSPVATSVFSRAKIDRASGEVSTRIVSAQGSRTYSHPPAEAHAEFRRQTSSTPHRGGRPLLRREQASAIRPCNSQTPLLVPGLSSVSRPLPLPRSRLPRPIAVHSHRTVTSSGSPIEQYRNSPPESESRGLASRRNSRNQSERQGSSNEEPGFFTTGEKHQTEFDFDIYERLDLGYGSVAPLTHSQEEYGNTIPFAFRPSRDEPEPPLDFDQESRTGDQPILEYKPPSASYQSDPAEGPFSRAARSAVPAKMENPRTSRFLDPASARDSVMTSQKVAAIKIAKEQEKAIHEKLRRNGHDIPKYEFQELIGKGAYGRVFKCLDQEHNRVVALKVIDVDTTDYKVNARAKDETIDVTVHEIKVLSQLKDSKAKNVNIMFDAFQIHSQLWIVNDYCPGGSVHTLMRATASKLEEKYIVPVARELAEALKAIHTAGIIHRDVKSANVMIHENGSLQVIDFGVAGVLQTKVDKRTTVIGTPHWMPPELHKLAPPEGLTYGTEVDVWAYGCTLYEIATGQPPNFRVEPGRRLGATLGRNAPRLDSDRFSEGLCNLVAFVLEGKPADRPSMDAVLQERYINNSEETHPTRSLAELVKTYYRWERSGGQRQSLFFAGGAPAAEYPETLDNEGSWNFSLTESFEQEFVDTETLNSIPAPAVTINVEQAADTSFDSYLLSPTVYTPVTSPRPQVSMSDSPEGPKSTDTIIPQEKAYIEERVKRGEKAMQGLFDENQAPYKYEVKDDFNQQRGKQPVLSCSHSDLPLRHETEQSSLSHNELEVKAGKLETDSYDNMPNIDLANVNTIKANRMHRFIRDFDEEEKTEPQYANLGANKRSTMEWTFPLEDQASVTDANAAGSSKRATAEWTFPNMLAEQATSVPAVAHPRQQRTNTAPFDNLGDQHRGSTMLDLDELYDSDAQRTGPASGFASDEEPEYTAGPVYQAPHTEPGEATATTGDQPLGFDYGPTTAETSEHSTTSSDNEIEQNEFMLDESSGDEGNARSRIEDHLDLRGVDDVLERATLKRDFRQARTGMTATMRTDDVGTGNGDSTRVSPFAAGEDWEENGWWSEYNPDVNLTTTANGYPLGETRIGDADFPAPVELQSLSGAGRGATVAGGVGGAGRGAGNVTGGAGHGAGLVFPQPMPPSAESLMEGAPQVVVENELARLVNDWTHMLEVIGQGFGPSE